MGTSVVQCCSVLPSYICMSLGTVKTMKQNLNFHVPRHKQVKVINDPTQEVSNDQVLKQKWWEKLDENQNLSAGPTALKIAIRFSK